MSKPHDKTPYCHTGATPTPAAGADEAASYVAVVELERAFCSSALHTHLRTYIHVHNIQRLCDLTLTPAAHTTITFIHATRHD